MGRCCDPSGLRRGQDGGEYLQMGVTLGLSFPICRMGTVMAPTSQETAGGLATTA